MFVVLLFCASYSPFSSSFPRPPFSSVFLSFICTFLTSYFFFIYFYFPLPPPSLTLNSYFSYLFSLSFFRYFFIILSPPLPYPSHPRTPVLFGNESTDYEELSRVQKSFEPYSQLWQTATEWIEKSKSWLTGWCQMFCLSLFWDYF